VSAQQVVDNSLLTQRAGAMCSGENMTCQTGPLICGCVMADLKKANFRLADYPTRTPFKLCIGSCFHLPSQVLAETELFIMQRASRSASVSVWACDRLARAGLGWPIGEHCFERATEPILIKALVAWVHMIAVFAHEVAAPVRPAAVGVAKRVLIGQPPGAEDAA
jgi:hypothetical protein